MKKGVLTIAFSSLLTLTSFTTAFAGQWQQDPATAQWKYLNDAGTYYTNGWQWIDGNGDEIAECYYFDANGCCLTNTTTPDNYTVDVNGAWIINGVIQTQAVSAVQSALQQEIITEAVPTVIPQSTTGIASAPYEGYTIVVNTNTYKYHVPSCNSVDDIKPENLGYSSDSSYLDSNGYAACKRCH